MCDVNTIILTAGVLFLTGFVGDIGAQLYAKAYPRGDVALFEDYWNAYGRLGAAATAGLITLVFGGMMFLLALSVYKYGFNLNPTEGWTFVLFATAIGFILGVIVDLLANREDWIPSLRGWYDGVGESKAAMWSGGLTFAFVLFVTAVWWKLRSKTV